MPDKFVKRPTQGKGDKQPSDSARASLGSQIVSVVDALTALGKLFLVLAVLALLWTKREAVETYALHWLNSANKVGFLGLSVERQISAQQAVAEIAKDAAKVINLAFADGAIERAARNAPAIVGSRILWVDDHPTNNDPERDVLKALGIQVFRVKNTSEAIRFVPVLQPDLIITDVVRDGDQTLPLRKCPAHYFEMPRNVSGNLAELNSDLLQGKTRATGFSLPEAISEVDPSYTDHLTSRILFYSGSAGGRAASQCARLVTNRPDVLLHSIVSALEERNWEKLKQQPSAETKATGK
ncbi:hypothetical protein [Bradyrhizobium sp. SZCCHNRI1073]|uniref:hypothetical protein n=1 Tax=Bradyrhizobium sp. SZCCHNRI1073 TaxID=3057280 RepID=UPI002916B637|nr:hypothetical protein [Bradyrhizobium sp. SZCCHNRI1073]